MEKRAVSQMAAQVDSIKGVGGYLRHTESQARPPTVTDPTQTRTHTSEHKTSTLRTATILFFILPLPFLSLSSFVSSAGSAVCDVRWVFVASSLICAVGLDSVVTFCACFFREVWLVHIFLSSRRVSRSRFHVCCSLLNCCVCSDSVNATSSP